MTRIKRDPDSILEEDVKADIKKFLTERGCYYFMPVQHGLGARSVDILACLPTLITPADVGTYRGLFAGIEAKRPGEEPTGAQYNTLREIKDSCGKALWIDNVGKIAAHFDLNLIGRQHRVLR